MLKTKLTYMILGAIIASLGYFIGTLNNLNAEDEVARVKRLIVSEELVVGEKTKITKNSMSLSAGKYLLLLAGDRITWHNLHDNDQKPRIVISLTRENDITSGNPVIELRKPKGNKITLSIDDQSSIKLSNGGLKSKTVKVE